MSQKENTFGAKKIVWDLSDLFSSLEDPRIKTVMTKTLDNATHFEKTYKTKVESNIKIKDIIEKTQKPVEKQRRTNEK